MKNLADLLVKKIKEKEGIKDESANDAESDELEEEEEEESSDSRECMEALADALESKDYKAMAVALRDFLSLKD